VLESLYYRHCFLLEGSEAVKKIPTEIVQKGLQIYDEQIPGSENNQQQQPTVSSATAAVQVLSLFLQSLLPNYVIPTATAPPNQATATNALNVLGPQGFVAQLLQEEGLDVNNPDLMMMEQQLQQQQQQEEDWE